MWGIASDNVWLRRSIVCDGATIAAWGRFSIRLYYSLWKSISSVIHWVNTVRFHVDPANSLSQGTWRR